MGRRDQLRFLVRHRDVPGATESEHRLEQGMRVAVGGTRGEPLSQVPQLALPADPAPLGEALYYLGPWHGPELLIPLYIGCMGAVWLGQAAALRVSLLGARQRVLPGVAQTG